MKVLFFSIKAYMISRVNFLKSLTLFVLRSKIVSLCELFHYANCFAMRIVSLCELFLYANWNCFAMRIVSLCELFLYANCFSMRIVSLCELFRYAKPKIFYIFLRCLKAALEINMSFSNEVKNELCSVAIKKNCCKKAFVLGALMSADISDDKIVLSVNNENHLKNLSELIKQVFRTDVTLRHSMSRLPCGKVTIGKKERGPEH